MTWPTHYPDRPAIPHDTSADGKYGKDRRAKLRYAEAGLRPGAPVKRIPHLGLVNDRDGER